MTTRPGDPRLAVGRSSWHVWGTTAALAVRPASFVISASRILREEIQRIDAACNRFSPTSELSRLRRSVGRPTAVSEALLEALLVACRAAQRTDGAVDPTVGSALCQLGYDRDFDEIADPDTATHTAPATGTDPVGRPAAGWRAIALDAASRTVALPAGVVLDLGATAKALCADRAAARIAGELGSGVVVALGGDVAAAGPPVEGGWQVALVDDARSAMVPPHPSRPVVSLWRGGLATSGTTSRRWRSGDTLLHHVIDPSTGLPAPPVWTMVSVAAASCVEANTASTAAIVWAEDAPFRLAQMGVAARFVPADGSEVVTVGGWPDDPVAGDWRAERRVAG